MLFHSTDPVTLIGGGKCSRKTLSEALSLARKLVAADGGADRALELGATPELVIGDLDSLSADAEKRLTTHKIDEQNSTDFDKALRSIDAPFVIGVGFLGGRIDHSLAVMHGLVRHATRRCLLLSKTDIVFHCTNLEVDVSAGTRFSIFPFAQVTGRSKGLKWPIQDLLFDPAAKIGTSNEALGPVTLAMEGPGTLVIMPRAALRAVLSARLWQ